jgi:sporulation-control protein
MALRRLLAVGVDLETVLLDQFVVPGGELTGEVRFTGGRADRGVDRITLVLRYGEVQEGANNREFELHRVRVSGAFVVAAGAAYQVPFRVPLPWETPLTESNGRRAARLFVSVRAELELGGGVESSDRYPLWVRGLPAQQRILDTLHAIGYQLHDTSLGMAALPGSELVVPQHFGFRQQFSSRFLLGASFVAGPTSLDLVLVGTNAAPSGRLGVPDLWDASPFAANVASRTNGRYVRSTVDYSWLDEELDWEGWLGERIAVLKAAR